MKHADEFRRCLIEVDVAGILKISAHVDPHLPRMSPAEALISIHIARVDAKSIPTKLKLYSAAFLAERGYQKVDGNWISGLDKPQVIVEAVGIASMSKDPAFAKKVTTAMRDALLNGLEKGITEPPMQRELMFAARAKVRRKAGLIT